MTTRELLQLIEKQKSLKQQLNVLTEFIERETIRVHNETIFNNFKKKICSDCYGVLTDEDYHNDNMYCELCRDNE